MSERNVKKRKKRQRIKKTQKRFLQYCRSRSGMNQLTHLDAKGVELKNEFDREYTSEYHVKIIQDVRVDGALPVELQ